MSAVTHRRFPARRAPRAATWWAKAWLRAVEESAYAEEDLRKARALARSGGVGAITVDSGTFLAAVQEGDDAWTVTGTVPVVDGSGVQTLVELVAAEAGRVAALLAGELPLQLVEDADESGVELLPYGGELGAACTCDAWADPCRHALAVLHQLGWLLGADPFVLLQLRGLPRDDLLARLHARTSTEGSEGMEDLDPRLEDDLDTALDAAARARRLLELLEDPTQPVDHLF
ncbi:SWIM zinc finger family protein [Nocardioides pacificus]